MIWSARNAVITITYNRDAAAEDAVQRFIRRTHLDRVAPSLEFLALCCKHPKTIAHLRVWVSDLRDYMPADWQPPAVFQQENP